MQQCAVLAKGLLLPCADPSNKPCPPPARSYVLSLPKGSFYHALAGKLQSATSVELYGLRRFRLPFRQDFAEPQDRGASVYDGAG